MTLESLRNNLVRCESLAACDGYLRVHLYEIRPLFYGLTRSELRDCRFRYEDALLSFINSPAGRGIQGGDELPASVTALLLFFVSIFERAQLYAAIQNARNLLPPGSLRDRADAIFSYKNITNASRQYVGRFQKVVGFLERASSEASREIRSQREDLLLEYALDALLCEGADRMRVRSDMEGLFQDEALRVTYPILRSQRLQTVFSLTGEELNVERRAVRSRIMESLHREACEMVPESLIDQVSEELSGEELPVLQTYRELPPFLDDQIASMGGIWSPQQRSAGRNLDADEIRNRIYLGTYLPRTVLESENIFSELLLIPVINRAFAQKDIIRVLDVCSGTGGAMIGLLLSLANHHLSQATIEITSLDGNREALNIQQEIIHRVGETLGLDVTLHVRVMAFPSDLDGFVDAYSAIADEWGRRFDIITFWKCLCEFYNEGFAQAQGVIRNALRISSRMLTPYSLCILCDVTANNNGMEFFSMTLNREANEHDALQNARVTTILPVPCARHSRYCNGIRCYTQRKFEVMHRLRMGDESKVGYRVFAPNVFTKRQATQQLSRLSRREPFFPRPPARDKAGPTAA